MLDRIDCRVGRLCSSVVLAAAGGKAGKSKVELEKILDEKPDFDQLIAETPT